MRWSESARNTGPILSATPARRYIRERIAKFVPYDHERFGPYPELLAPFLESFPLRLVYRKGKIAGRSDIMETLDRLDAEMMNRSVDVIIPTRNREEHVLAAIEQTPERRLSPVPGARYRSERCPVRKNYTCSFRFRRFEGGLSPDRSGRVFPPPGTRGFEFPMRNLLIFIDDDIDSRSRLHRGTYEGI